MLSEWIHDRATKCVTLQDAKPVRGFDGGKSSDELCRNIQDKPMIALLLIETKCTVIPLHKLLGPTSEVEWSKKEHLKTVRATLKN
jgi:hypothetical protein